MIVDINKDYSSKISFPKVSIISVSFNTVEVAERTIKSILNLEYENLELIVVDKESNDGTLAIYNKYKNNIDILIVEPDLGPYDAMNKGIIRASGEWIWFMNMGDSVFEKKDILKVIFNQPIRDEILILFGNVFVFKSNLSYTKTFYEKVSQNVAFDVLNLNHQSMLIRKSVFDEFGYFAFQEFKIKADAYLLTNLWKQKGNKSFYHVGLIMSKYNEEGISSNPANFKIMQHEDRLIISKLGSKIQLRKYNLYCYYINLKIALYLLVFRYSFLIKLYHRLKYGFQTK
jgi:glycosyltransferase involved in cell wall biosynthesis